MKSQLRIYQIAEYLSQSGNGVNEWVFQTCNLLAEELHFSFIYFDLNKNETYVEEIENGFQKIHFPKFTFKGFILPKHFLIWLSNLPKGSIFHLHSVFRPLNFSILNATLKYSHLTIFTPHDSYSKNSMRKNAVLKKLFFSFFDSYLLQKVNLINAISRDGFNDLSNLTDNEIFLTNNFYKDDNLFKEANYKINKKTICYIGRLDVFQKGIDLSLDAFNSFNCNKNYNYVLIGSYTKNEFDILNSLIKRVGLELNKDIILTGFVTEETKKGILLESFAYLQLSRFEGFGLSIVEALSFGKPVIISENVPISHTISTYKAGYVVRNRDEAVLALGALSSMPEAEYRSICICARKCYEEVYHPKVAKGRLLEMFSMIKKME
jgi:glycosyltransferase involved in cell wall biosynthesis